MSEKYRLMIYFVTATLFIYQGDMEWNENIKSPDDFAKANPEHTKRVFEEAKNVFSYELSYNQLMIGIKVYMKTRMSPQKVYETEAYQRTQQQEYVIYRKNLIGE